MATDDKNRAVKLLESIDRKLDVLLSRHELAGRGAGTAQAAVADDRDLDSTHGDEQVKFKPRDWSGDDFKGCNFSQCPADFLDLLADAYAYFARKNDESFAKASNGEMKSKYDRRTESRARGWARRIRAGWKSPHAEPSGFETSGFEADTLGGDMNDSDIGF